MGRWGRFIWGMRRRGGGDARLVCVYWFWKGGVSFVCLLIEGGVYRCPGRFLGCEERGEKECVWDGYSTRIGTDGKKEQGQGQGHVQAASSKDTLGSVCGVLSLGCVDGDSSWVFGLGWLHWEVGWRWYVTRQAFYSTIYVRMSLGVSFLTQCPFHLSFELRILIRDCSSQSGTRRGSIVGA